MLDISWVGTNWSGRVVALIILILFEWTLVRLFVQTRAYSRSRGVLAGSFLAAGILTSSLLAFTLAISTSSWDARQLVQAVPILVVAIGFDKPLRLVDAVLATTGNNGQRNMGTAPPSSNNNILRRCRRVLPSITAQYMVEGVIILLASFSPAAARTCRLFAWILLWDFVLLWLFFAPLLVLYLQTRPYSRAIHVQAASPVWKVFMLLLFVSAQYLYNNNPSSISDNSPVQQVPVAVHADASLLLLAGSTILAMAAMFATVVVNQWTDQPKPRPIAKVRDFVAERLIENDGIDKKASNGSMMHSESCETLTDVDHTLEKAKANVSPCIAQLIAIDEISKKTLMSTVTVEEAPKPIAQVDPKADRNTMSDADLMALVKQGQIPSYTLESTLNDMNRAVRIRRNTFGPHISDAIPHDNFDYSQTHGKCCENVIGYIPIPLGLAGPLTLDGQQLYIPMATTEGCLVASTSRGAKAISMSGGATTIVLKDGMSRGPVLKFPSITLAAELITYIQDNMPAIKLVFESTSRYAKLETVLVFNQDQGASSRQARLCALCHIYGRRDGNEHDIKGRRKNTAAFLAAFLFHANHLNLG